VRGEGNVSGGILIVGIFHLDGEPPRRERALPEPQPQRLGESPEQRMQHAEIVGVGGEGMRQPVLRLDRGGQDRPSVDPAAPGAEHPAPRAEDRAELALGDGGHLPDFFQLILVETEQDVIGYVGKHPDEMGRQEGRLRAEGHQHGPEASGPSRPGGGFRDQLVHGHSHRERQPEPFGRFASDPLGHIDGRTEQSFGAADIQKGVSIALGLDDRRIDPEDFVERPGRAGVEPGIGRQQDQIGTELPRQPYSHAARDSRRLRLGRKRQHRGAIGTGRRHRERPAPKCRSHQALDRGAEGGGIDEQDGLHGLKNLGFGISSV